MKPHAFVAMPFGTKNDADGKPIDFNRVYSDYIKPALERAGCEVFRADEETRAGDIRFDMFQELLVADLVLAELTLDNPNVWYELGVRHALRARGVLLVQGPRPTQPFDIVTDRKLRYSLAGGGPDPATLEKDIEALATLARDTLAAASERKVSPVYKLLPNLREPQWRDLLLGTKNEFSQGFEAWERRMKVAQQKNLPGDLLVLADETPTQALRLEAKRMAGNSLMKLQHFNFALEQFDAALEIDDQDKRSREKRGVCLGRTGRLEEAREWQQALARDYPADAEAHALVGRVEKEDWVSRWRVDGHDSAQMRNAAADEDAVLADAIAPYEEAFRLDARHFYSGINGLTLRVLRCHLQGETDAAAQIDELLGGVRWAVQSALQREPKDYWARASAAELSLLCFDTEAVRRDWRAAVAAADRDWFALDSSRQTLTLLRDLEFRPAETALALELVDKEIARSAMPFVPRQVFLFSGHMVDAPGRAKPRFPANKVPEVAAMLQTQLDELGAGAGDLLLTQGAAGGDLLMAEACAARGVRVQLLLPLAEPEFIERSVLPSTDGEAWRQRYLALRDALKDPPRVMPAELGPLPRGANEFERCNQWLLYTALGWGQRKVRFVCLWDGGGGDGPGGTAHMYNEVKRRTGQVSWLRPPALA